MSAATFLQEAFANAPKIRYKSLSDDQADLLDGTPIDSDVAHCAIAISKEQHISAESVIGVGAGGNTGAYVFIDIVTPGKVQRFGMSCFKYETAEVVGLDALRKLMKLTDPTPERAIGVLRRCGFRSDTGQFDPASPWIDDEEYGDRR